MTSKETTIWLRKWFWRIVLGYALINILTVAWVIYLSMD